MIKTIVSNYDGTNLDEIVKELQAFMYTASVRHLESCYYRVDGSRFPVHELRSSVSSKIKKLRKLHSDVISSNSITYTAANQIICLNIK